MFGSSRFQPLNIINLWRAVSVINLLYNSSINIGANKNMLNNNVQTLSFLTKPPLNEPTSTGQLNQAYLNHACLNQCTLDCAFLNEAP